MKVKRTISKRPQESQVVIGTQDPPFHYSHIQAIMPFLGLSKEPSATDCEDLNLNVYHRVEALIQMFDAAQSGLEAEHSEFFAETTQAALDALQFEVEIGRLAAQTLFKLYSRDSRDSKPCE
jgi:hypothetical protein